MMMQSALSCRTVHAVLAAEDPLTLAGLEGVLDGSPEVELVDSFAQADVAVCAAARLDVRLLPALKTFRADGGPAVVVVADEADPDVLPAAIEAGLGGLLLRSQVTRESLSAAMLAVALGHGQMPTDLVALMAAGRSDDRPRESPALARHEHLTQREQQVVVLLAEGMQTDEIAKQMNYSARTVKNILSGLMVRMNLRNRTHVVAWAFQRGWL